MWFTKDKNEDQELQKQKILTKQEPSVTQSVADATVIKEDDLFFLCAPDGSMPLDEEHGYGLYFEDARYLGGYKICVGGEKLTNLGSRSQERNASLHQLTNSKFQSKSGNTVASQKMGIEIHREVDSGQRKMKETISFRNYSLDEIHCDVEIEFKPSFEDVFAIRGLCDSRPGEMDETKWKNETFEFTYHGKDNRDRILQISFDKGVHRKEKHSITYDLKLKPQDESQLVVEYKLGGYCKVPKKTHSALDASNLDPDRIETNNLVINHAIEQCFGDLAMLRTELNDKAYIAAGVPWFVTLFGRDSALISLQLLPFDSKLAKDTVELLADLQGKEVNTWKDEEPGKIIHEFRQGELAQMDIIPHTPFYGSIDATPLFLTTITEYCHWTGDLDFFKKMQPSIEAALNWIDDYGDKNKDGFYEYDSSTHFGLINQGWRDSGNGIVNSTGEIAKPPITLVEMQGYVYQAKNGIARLYELVENHKTADRLRKEASDLKARFNKKFWMKEEKLFALGIDGNNKLLDVATSNSGHALWSEIVDESLAKDCVERMFEEDLFSGWGVRTLSTREKAYNPVGYHLGTVWPHDNALFMAGMKKYGFSERSKEIFDTLLEASLHFENRRLPELFSGYSRKEFGKPIPYPVACHPQAWAATSIPYMLTQLLGLRPDAFNNELRIVNPVMPHQAEWVRLKKLRLGPHEVDLHFTKTEEGTAVHVDSSSKDLKVIVELTH